MSHARLSPSSAKRWMVCPASVNRTAHLPDSDNDAALWGTACHAILERALLQSVDPRDVDVAGLSGAKADGSLWRIEDWGQWDVTEMRQTALAAYAHVLFAGQVLAESKTNPGAVIGRDDCYGTADITVLNYDHIEVVDLKTGKGVYVDPEDPQLLLYALGKVNEHSMPDHAVVVCTIVQPRYVGAPAIRSHTTSAGALRLWALEQFAPAALATDHPDAPAIPDEDACRFCKAKGTCPELAQKGLEAAQAVFRPVPGHEQGERANLAEKLTRDPTQLTAEEIRFILDHEKLITGWLSAVREYASEQLKGGHAVPGYKLVAGRSSRSWSVDHEMLYKKLKNLSKQDGSKITKQDLYTQTVVSPAQAEKQIKPLVAGSTWKRIEEFIVKSAGAPTLAPETDSRPALLTDARQVFQPIEQAPAEADVLPDFLQ